MSDLNFTTEEQTAISQYSQMSVRVNTALNRVAAEVVPALTAFGYGLYKEKTLFLVLGMFILVYAAGYRKFKEFGYGKLLQSICSKIEAHNKPQSAA